MECKQMGKSESLRIGGTAERQQVAAVPAFRRLTVVNCRWLGGAVHVVLQTLLVGCGARFDPSIYPSPEQLFEASLQEFQSGDCTSADIGFQRLAFELPARDPKRAEVRFYLAECSFKRRDYLEATRNFRRVADEHASDSLAPVALLRAGDAYARLWRRPELDSQYGVSALATYQELLRRYPSSPGVVAARERIANLNEWFAIKAYKAGMYYFRLKAYDSAIIYFKDVVAEYPATSQAPEALLRLVEAYDRIGYEEDMRDMCQQLQRFYADWLPRAEACLADTSFTPGRG